MTLDQAELNISYRFESFQVDDDYLQARLVHFGFSPGVKLTVKRVAPVFRDPLLVEIDGSQIMIAKDQAKLLIISKEKL